MMWLNDIGGCVRWILKGCKTPLKDELYCYTFENHIVGMVFCILIVILLTVLIP